MSSGIRQAWLLPTGQRVSTATTSTCAPCPEPPLYSASPFRASPFAPPPLCGCIVCRSATRPRLQALDTATVACARLLDVEPFRPPERHGPEGVRCLLCERRGNDCHQAAERRTAIAACHIAPAGVRNRVPAAILDDDLAASCGCTPQTAGGRAAWPPAQRSKALERSSCRWQGAAVIEQVLPVRGKAWCVALADWTHA